MSLIFGIGIRFGTQPELQDLLFASLQGLDPDIVPFASFVDAEQRTCGQQLTHQSGGRYEARWLVTGASSGIGAAVTRLAREAGHDVLALDVDDEAGATLAAETGAEDPESMRRLIDALPIGSLGINLDPGNANTHVWYENDGFGTFTRHDIDTTADGAHSIVTGDMDLDGDIDLLVSNQDGDSHAWYENDGSGGFTRHDIDTAADGAHSIVTGDMDQDGDIDLLTSNQDAGNIAWYENDGNENFSTHALTTTADGAISVFAVDMDGDSDTDVLAASYRDDTVTWYENDGSGSFVARPVDGAALGAYGISTVDIDADGLFDDSFVAADTDGGVIERNGVAITYLTRLQHEDRDDLAEAVDSPVPLVLAEHCESVLGLPDGSWIGRADR